MRSRNTAKLIAPVPMRKGAIARVDVSRPLAYGRGVLRWLLPPEIVPDR